MGARGVTDDDEPSWLAILRMLVLLIIISAVILFIELRDALFGRRRK